MDSLLRRLVDFETSEGADAGGGESGGVPADAPDFYSTPPDAPEPSASEPEPSQEERWAGPSQEEWQAAQQFQQQALPVLQALSQVLQQDPYEQYVDPAYYQQQPQQQMPEDEEFDPFDQQQIGSLVQQHVQAALQQSLGPFESIMGVVASEKGEQLAKAELEQIHQQVGDFDNDTAFLVASGMIEGGTDPSEALRTAATYAQQYEQKIRADERAKVQEEMNRLREAPRETPIGSASATEGVPVPTGANRYETAIQNALARRNPAMPAG